MAVTKAGKQLFKLDTQVTVHISSDITLKKFEMRFESAMVSSRQLFPRRCSPRVFDRRFVEIYVLSIKNMFGNLCIKLAQ